jgi:hypothetical protein
MQFTFEVTQVQVLEAEVVVAGTPGAYDTGDNTALVDTVLNQVGLRFPGADSPMAGLKPGDTITVELGQKPVVLNIDPEIGEAGVRATVWGTGLTGARDIEFDGVTATNLTVHSDKDVQCDVPAHADGAVQVTVTTYLETSDPGGSFTYQSSVTEEAAKTETPPANAKEKEKEKV